MSNKRIQVSDDNGSTYVTLPGNQGELTDEMGNVTDTIFGQTYESQSPTLGQWGVTSNGLYKGIAGYQAVIKKSGTPTTMTAEACNLVSGKTYQVTAATKRVISYADGLTVLDNAVDQTANVISIDYLTGKVTFATAYTPTGAITVTGKYMPMTQAAKGRSFNLQLSVNQLDETGYDDAQGNTGYRVFDEGLRSVSLELGGISKAATGWRDILVARSVLYVEVDLNAADPGKNIFRGFFRSMNRGQSGNQGDVESETVQLQLYVPEGDLVARPFGWDIASASTLNPAIKKILTAVEGQTTIKVRYLPSGAISQSPLDGVVGDAIVAECSLANSIDGQNEFSFNFRGTGAASAV